MCSLPLLGQLNEKYPYQPTAPFYFPARTFQYSWTFCCHALSDLFRSWLSLTRGAPSRRDGAKMIRPLLNIGAMIEYGMAVLAPDRVVTSI
jgi:hypothetical protein